MSGGLLSRKTVLLAKQESTYGADPTLATTDAIEIFDLDIKQNSQNVERLPLRESLSPKSIGKSLRTVELTFSTELKGSGSAGTAPRIGRLFEACGMAETVDAGSSVVYDPTSTLSSVAFEVYRDGLKWQILGCMGTFEINAEAGKIPMVKWTFRGLYQKPTDAALPTGSYESTEGQVAESTSTAIQGYSSGIIRNYGLNVANDIADRPSLNASGAMQAVRIGGRKPSGKIVLEAELIATEDFFSNFDDGSALSFTSTIGATAGNIVNINASSSIQYDNMNTPDDNGILMFDLDLLFSGTDNEFQIKFT